MKRILLSVVLVAGLAGCAGITPEQAVNFDQYRTNVESLLPESNASLQTQIAASTAALSSATTDADKKQFAGKINDLAGRMALITPTILLGREIQAWFLAHVDKAKFDAEKARRAQLAGANGAH